MHKCTNAQTHRGVQYVQLVQGVQGVQGVQVCAVGAVCGFQWVLMG